MSDLKALLDWEAERRQRAILDRTTYRPAKMPAIIAALDRAVEQIEQDRRR